MSTKPRPTHSSIPGYRPGPILSKGQKNLLLGLVVGPLLTYGVLKLRQQQRNQQERLLEEEGRQRWYKEHGENPGVEDAGKSGGSV
ncbi:hypothetical protein H2198_006436 [Neophaeococcomyces mojaviensis]|uniref:Uncharacterized protein n=1 Tax=Neophaeococcomyces mojaviensis TaxID=3383035 RepID=A0ACC3A2Y7_9EURO|nr:hypothetical protein H2198_006436 [Knufia sp. JES_112]